MIHPRLLIWTAFIAFALNGVELKGQSVFRLENKEGGIQQFLIPKNGLPLTEFWKKYTQDEKDNGCNKNNRDTEFFPQEFQKRILLNVSEQVTDFRESATQDKRFDEPKLKAFLNLFDKTVTKFGVGSAPLKVNFDGLKQDVASFQQKLDNSKTSFIKDEYGPKFKELGKQMVTAFDFYLKSADHDAGKIRLIQVQKAGTLGAFSIYFPESLVNSFVGQFSITDNDSVKVENVDATIWSEVFLLDGYPRKNVISESRKNPFSVSGLVTTPSVGLDFSKVKRTKFKHVFTLNVAAVPEGDLIGKIVRTLPATSASPRSVHILYFPYFKIPRNYWSQTPSDEKNWLETQLVLGGDIISVDSPQDDPILRKLFQENKLKKLGLLKDQFIKELEQKRAALPKATVTSPSQIKPNYQFGKLPKLNLSNAQSGISKAGSGLKNMKFRLPNFKLPF